MQYLSAAAFVWAIVYLLLGYWLGFAGAINGTEGVLFLEIFFAPLPISVISFLRPKLAGMMLLMCLAASMLATAYYIVFEHRGMPPGQALGMFAGMGAYNIPHLVFGILLTKERGATQQADRSG